MNSSGKIELLAPGGDVDSIKAAILAGADAVYCGLNRFNARNRAENISFDDLNGLLGLAHKNNCKIFLTLNIIIVESEIPALIDLLNKLVNTSIDGLIIQDLGLCHILQNHFKRLNIHASTQLTTHNTGQIHFLHKLGATRVNLSRELSLTEIEQLSETAHQNDMLTEVFVHGSHCISFSGLCYMSSLNSGNSGNRGRCSQPCRDEYITTSQGVHFPLNLKDNSAFCDLRELVDAGVDSLKIEGRIKKCHYVYTVVNAWRKQVERFYNEDLVSDDKSELYTVFNRDFSNSFLRAEISRDMFIDNSRDHSALHLSGEYGGSNKTALQAAKNEIYNIRTDIITEVDSKICGLSIAKTPLRIHVSGDIGSPLKLVIETPDTSFVVSSNLALGNTSANPLSCEEIKKRLTPVNDTEFFIESIQFKNFANHLFLPFKELTAMKNDLLYILNGSRETIPPVTVPHFKKQEGENIRPTLSVLIDSTQDLSLCKSQSSDIYFQLPSLLKNNLSEILALFRENQNIIPWFPPIIIGEEYTAAVDFIEQSQRQCIVTNNTGIAYEAWKRDIPWIVTTGQE
jgi:putative protease